jgi:hypothetical protein
MIRGVSRRLQKLELRIAAANEPLPEPHLICFVNTQIRSGRSRVRCGWNSESPASGRICSLRNPRLPLMRSANSFRYFVLTPVKWAFKKTLQAIKYFTGRIE